MAAPGVIAALAVGAEGAAEIARGEGGHLVSDAPICSMARWKAKTASLTSLSRLACGPTMRSARWRRCSDLRGVRVVAADLGEENLPLHIEPGAGRWRAAPLGSAARPSSADCRGLLGNGDRCQIGPQTPSARWRRSAGRPCRWRSRHVRVGGALEVRIARCARMSFTACRRVAGDTAESVTAPPVETWYCAKTLPTSKVFAPASEVQSAIFAAFAVGTPLTSGYCSG